MINSSSIKNWNFLRLEKGVNSVKSIDICQTLICFFLLMFEAAAWKETRDFKMKKTVPPIIFERLTENRTQEKLKIVDSFNARLGNE